MGNRRGTYFPTGKTRLVPDMAAGIAGTPAFKAKKAQPGRNGCSFPSELTPPSGKTPMAPPVERFARACFIVPKSPLGWFTGRAPPAVIILPIKGSSNKYAAARKIIVRGMQTPSTSGSIKLWWLATSINGPRAGIWSRPDIVIPPVNLNRPLDNSFRKLYTGHTPPAKYSSERPL